MASKIRTNVVTKGIGESVIRQSSTKNKYHFLKVETPSASPSKFDKTRSGGDKSAYHLKSLKEKSFSQSAKSPIFTPQIQVTPADPNEGGPVIVVEQASLESTISDQNQDQDLCVPLLSIHKNKSVLMKRRASHMVL